MTRITVNRIILAPIESVFSAVADIENLPGTNPDIVKIEFLTDQKSGHGTRFRETRLMNNKESVTDLEITEYSENEHIRMVAESHGTVWDSVFSFHREGDATELTLVMDAHTKNFFLKIMNFLMKSFFKKGLEKHVDALKNYCER